ncbi:MAG: T9SS type A sorting domain-containing protein, partial [Cytophagales bacterium]|nr:T9SS type A sorting domain-containing protein [Cytophagales bacterium]
NAQISSSTDFTIQVTNSLGASIFTTRGLSTGYYSKEFDFSSLAAGVYFVSLKAGDDFIVKKVIIE